MDINEKKGILKEIQDPDILYKTFDTKVALTGLYLWLLFGFISSMASCDLQRWMRKSALFRHFVGIVSFFLLFTVSELNNKPHIGVLWAKTIFIYIVFLLLMKSKWYFSLPILLILVIDQSMKIHSEYLVKENDLYGAAEWNTFRNKINMVILILIGVGCIHYGVRQYLENGSDFSMFTFLSSYGCKNG